MIHDTCTVICNLGHVLVLVIVILKFIKNEMYVNTCTTNVYPVQDILKTVSLYDTDTVLVLY